MPLPVFSEACASGAGPIGKARTDLSSDRDRAPENRDACVIFTIRRVTGVFTLYGQSAGHKKYPERSFRSVPDA